GDDDAGRFLRQVFQDNGVDVTFLRMDPALTSAVLIVNLTADGATIYLPLFCVFWFDLPKRSSILWFVISGVYSLWIMSVYTFNI
ncbi:hypothetical protein MJL81_31315, partial [Salmonella enterica subsp. enterica serovar Anatum]|nr:hypothetical protein [Salmonella enterica subsp. enterica serovar Anatum]